MSIATMILGESGGGKSTSMRNLDPEKTLVLQAVRKPLPFPSKNWRPWNGKERSGSIYVTDDAKTICAAIYNAHEYGKEVVVIDDAQYIMANEFMRRSNETGFNKFTDIGRNFWEIMNAANNAASNVRVYVMSHIQRDEMGGAKAKTIGKLLDEKITIEGMFTIVLRSYRSDGQYLFATQTSGMDTCKSPMGLFESETIENDLAAVDAAIVNYYS